jgi:nitrous oxide reductase accessory protein NosL
MRINLGHGFTAHWDHGDKFIIYRTAAGTEYDWLYIMGDNPNFMDAWKAFYVREIGNY